MSAQHTTGTATPRRVLVLGAGYAGMSAAVQLAARVGGREDVRVTLVNAQERFTERMRLHMSATGRRLAELSVPKLLEGTGARFVRGWVRAVDAKTRTVRVDDDLVLHYDTLVYGLGGVADTAAVPGAEEHAYTLDGARDAELLADRLARLGRGTVVVGGSGLTGVESAAEIAERYPELGVVLLGSREPGADMNPGAGAYLRSALRRLGVRTRDGVEVVRVLPDAVELTCGERVAADVVLCTGGTRAAPLAAPPGWPSTSAAASSPTPRCGRSPTRGCTPWATRPRSARDTASCTAPARAACRPVCTRRSRSSVSWRAGGPSRSASATTTRR
ncbi:NADH dehydrogenase FAD-containing subunit [Nocardiopsis arvandica]|uniref:NADH dehydrogenase FAD-containing subunit n=1 Tax=Nocardiopsis sinuspersici TaxID=501010 RepID=A0A7Y9X8C2_9ACTN|nr:FAD-dependent oxidoreductase [Nocardiopsis sinuspersici]NYH51024.1 NADH dehydrogenase FAD-containing subunit [Nocardiopsis sinuspersici]